MNEGGELSVSLSELKTAIAAIQDPVWLLDRRGRVILANEEALRLHGFGSLEECNARLPSALAAYDVRRPDGQPVPTAERPLARALRGDYVDRLELHVRSPAGAAWIGLYTSTPLRTSEGRTLVKFTIRDVTRQRQAERERSASEARLAQQGAALEAVFAALADAVVVYGADGVAIRANAAATRILGFDPVGRELGANMAAARTAGDPRASATGRALRGETVTALPFDFVDQAGVQRTVLASSTPMRDAQGRVIGAVTVSHDVTERVRAEQALRDSEASLRGILNAARESIWLFSTDGVALLGNETALARWGRPAETIIGRPIEEALPPDLARSRLARMREAAASGPVEFEDVRAGIQFEHRFYPVRGADGRVDRIASFSRDVTARRRDEEALRRANEALSEANRHKDEFLGMLSHELRNPLAAITSSIHVLERADPAGDQAARARRVIRRQAELLERLVEDLLDVTRIARGKIELRRERLDLGVAAARAADDVALAMAAQGVAFHVDLPGAPVLADADPARLTQVIGNLLHNAAKFTPRGGEVRLELSAADGIATLTVSDTGQGIDPALLATIFEPFVQGGRTLEREHGGLGLGLSLVKGLVELHGGTVRAESAGAGRGARFVVSLPLARALAPAPAKQGRRPGRRRRVLVVDDNLDVAESLADLLRLAGHEVEVASDGPAGIAAARAHPPDVVLCDIGLPGVSGYEVARTLRADGAEVLLVALSGYGQPEDVRAALAAGFDRHLVKPASPAEIEALLGA